jgi:hypothetical protein
LEGLRNFLELFSLFSSFLRGASCPKSPRVAATAAASFMLEKQGDVKNKALPQNSGHHIGTLVRQMVCDSNVSSGWRNPKTRRRAPAFRPVMLIAHLQRQTIGAGIAMVYCRSRREGHWGIEE